MELIYVGIGIVVILLLWLVATRNGLVSGKIKVQESESGIDVALTKRFDVLTKMIEVVKGYAKHEKETLERVIQLRNSVHSGNTTLEQKQEMVNTMDQAMRAINVVVEQYPVLKANENFSKLQSTIADVEEHLQAARRVYNANVSAYNLKVQMFPSSIVAGMFHFETLKFFEAEEFKRKDVEMKF